MSWTHTLLRNGTFSLDAGCMFGLIPRVIWTRWLTPDDQNRMVLQQNSLLLEQDGHKVLIEVGIGAKLSDKEQQMYSAERRSILDSLKEVGCDPADINTVILTHLHFDHAGGLTHHDPEAPEGIALSFPNANIIVQKKEWEDAIANRSTMNKTYLRSHLTEAVAKQTKLVEGEVEVLPNLWVFPTPGHTWGQQSVRFHDSSGGVRCFVSDVMPTHLHASATTNLAYDVEPYTSMVARMELLKKASDEGWVLLPNHDPSPNPFFVCKSRPEKPGAFDLTPESA